MEKTVESILEEWGMASYAPKFEEEEITLDDFYHLSEDVINKLITKVGPNDRFKRKHKLLTEARGKTANSPIDQILADFLGEGASGSSVENNAVSPDEVVAVCEKLPNGQIYVRQITEERNADSNVELIPTTRATTPETPALASTSSSNLTVTIPLGDDRLQESTDLSPPAPKKLRSDQKSVDVEPLLAKTVVGKAVAALGKKKLLDHKLRLELAEQIILAELGDDTLKVLSPPRMKELADAICIAFPGEVTTSYYVPRVPGNKSKGIKPLLPKGALIDKYNNLTRLLRRAGVREGRKAATGDEEEDVEGFDDDTSETLRWLRSCNASQELTLPKWTATHGARLQELQTCEKPSRAKISTDKILEYFDKYKVLKRDWGYKLLLDDFTQMYDGKHTSLIDSWPSVSQKIQTLANLTYNDNNDGDTVRTLKLIPHLFRQPLLLYKNNKTTKGKSTWKPSSLESENGFLLHVKVIRDLELEIDRFRKKCESVNQTLQPFPAIVGTDEDTITDCYVVCDTIRYRVDTPLEAVDTCFKLYQALHAQYPCYAFNAWLFVQRAIYGIVTKWDQIIPNVETAVQKYRNI